MVSAYSFISAMIFFNLALVFVYFMRHNTDFLVKYSTTALMLLFVLGVVRLLTPLDLPQAVVIPSVTILPWMQRQVARTAGWLTVGQWLLLLWALGTAIVLVARARELILSWRCRRRFIRVDNPQVRRISREFDVPDRAVIVSPDVVTPQVVGLFRPHIYMPCLKLTDDELRWIFRHELIHINGHDTWVKLFYLLLEAVFWWNPVVYIFQNELELLLELRCDATLSASLDDTGRQAYLGTILNVIKQITGGQAGQMTDAVAFSKPGCDVKQRFYFVLEHDEKKARTVKTLLLCSMLLCFALSYFVIFQPVTEPPFEDIVGAFEITSDNAYLRMADDGKYLLYVDDMFQWKLDAAALQKEPYSQLKIMN